MADAEDGWPAVCWVVSWDHWGESGVTVEGVFATEQAAQDFVANSNYRDVTYDIERWDVTSNPEWPTPESMVAADPDRALEFSKQLEKLVWPIQTAKREASKQAQRDAGQVWWAIYDRYHARGRLECFTLEDAKDYLTYGSTQGELAPVGIELPDGTISNDWRTDDDDDDE